MYLRGFLAVVICVFVAGVTLADNGMDHSKPKSVTATCAFSSADVSWEPVTQANLLGYDVYARATGESIFTKANPEPVEATVFTVQGLSVRVSYDFAVTAVYSNGESEKSQIAVCTTG